MYEARWRVYGKEKAPQCTGCGMWMPFARYRRKNGLNAREITDYCPSCGAKIIGYDDCEDCPCSNNGKWQDNGICYACRGDAWVFGRPRRVKMEETARKKIEALDEVTELATMRIMDTAYHGDTLSNK